MILELLHNGKALARFEDMCVAQGVEADIAKQLCSDPYSVMRKSNHETELRTTSGGKKVRHP
jgi:thymidine phosphorylase